MSKIEIETRELQIRETASGDEFVGFKGGTAFDEGFIKEMKALGVTKQVELESEKEE